jgi:opine dehydrogenase
MGFDVALYNRSPQRISAIQELAASTWMVKAFHTGLAGWQSSPPTSPRLCSTPKPSWWCCLHQHMLKLPKACPAFTRRANHCAASGRTCGAIEFADILRQQNCQADVTISEAETFLYASRTDGPVQAHIFRVKEAVSASRPAGQAHLAVLEVIRQAYPQYIDGGNVLQKTVSTTWAPFFTRRSACSTPAGSKAPTATTSFTLTASPHRWRMCWKHWIASV